MPHAPESCSLCPLDPSIWSINALLHTVAACGQTFFFEILIPPASKPTSSFAEDSPNLLPGQPQLQRSRHRPSDCDRVLRPAVVGFLCSSVKGVLRRIFHSPPEALECSVSLGVPVSSSCLRLRGMRDCCMRKNVCKVAWLPQPNERQLPGRCEAGRECLGGLDAFEYWSSQV